jgi:hypothetical protein
MRCCVAKADQYGEEMAEIIAGPSGESLGTPDFRHVTTLRVKAPFHPPKRTPLPPLKGTHRYTRQLFEKNGPLQSLPTKLLNHPDKLQMWQNFIDGRETPGYANLAEKVVALQIVTIKQAWDLSKCAATPHWRKHSDARRPGIKKAPRSQATPKFAARKSLFSKDLGQICSGPAS